MKFALLILCLYMMANVSGQNVGIGTTSPISKLTIQTPINTTGFTHIGGTNEIVVTEAIGGVSASFGTTTNHAFRLTSNNVARVSIYPAGEVVVGDNNFAPLGKFAVQSIPGSYGITNSDGNIILSTFLGGTNQFAYIGTQTNHPLSFYTNNSASQAILLPNGNFGIGINNPAARLHVSGASRLDGNSEISGSLSVWQNIAIKTSPSSTIGLNIFHDNEAIRIAGNQSYITFFNDANYKGYLWNKGTDDMELGTAGVNNNGRLFLSIKGVPYLTLHNNGRIAINGPLANFNSNFVAPALTVSGPFTLKDRSNNFNEWALDSYGEDLSFDFNSLSKAWVDISGDWNSVSDMRFKENIGSYKSVLDDIMNLQVATYRYKSNPASRLSFGLLAQNVAAYFPEIVSERIDGAGNKWFGIAYGKTGVLAIKALQEQQSIIEKQQQEINSLSERLAALERLLVEKKQ